MTVEDAIAAYLDDVRVGRAPKTYRTRRTSLGRWVEFLEARDRLPADADDLDPEHVVDFARWILSSAFARNTADTLVSSVTTFYAYLVREDVRPDLPLLQLQLRLRALRGRHHRRLPRVPADAVVDAIVAAAARYRPRNHGTLRAELIRLRNVALVQTLRDSGLRVSEVCALRRGDLRDADRCALVTGKGGTDRLVFFTAAAWSALGAYLGTRGDDARGAELARLPVFARHDLKVPVDSRRGMDTASVRWTIRVLAELADARAERVTPHRFRAWFATHVVATTGDLAATQDLLGHAHADTTRVYVKVADARLRQVHDRAFA